MRIPAAVMLFALSTGVAQAQSSAAAAPTAMGPPRADRHLDHQQLRGDLRGAARPQRVSDSAVGNVATTAPVPTIPARHLTPRERAELRQQLSQEPAVKRKTNP